MNADRSGWFKIHLSLITGTGWTTIVINAAEPSPFRPRMADEFQHESWLLPRNIVARSTQIGVVGVGFESLRKKCDGISEDEVVGLGILDLDRRICLILR
jgi:hypothetical protein